MTSQCDHDLLPLVRRFGSRAPLTVAVVAALIAGGLGSLCLPLARDAAETSRAAIQLWTTSFTLGYVLFIVLFEAKRGASDVDCLAKSLRPDARPLDPALFARNRHPRALLATTVAGVLFGVVFNVLLDGVVYQMITGVAPTWAYAWGPPILMMLWGLVFHAFWILIDNARMLAHIAEHDLAVNLDDRSALDVFADAGARHFLFLVGGLAVLPVQSILAGGLALRDIVPSVVIVLPVAILVFLWPVLAARSAIERAKRGELARIDPLLRATEHLDDRYLLLSLHRHRIEQVPAWPVKLQNLARLTLYLVIPPLAWIAAAIVDTLVSRYV
jgi:hypothetical protein